MSAHNSNSSVIPKSCPAPRTTCARCEGVGLVEVLSAHRGCLPGGIVTDCGECMGWGFLPFPRGVAA